MSTDYGYGSWSVIVNGREIYDGKNCYMKRGYGITVDQDLTGASLNFDNWNFPKHYTQDKMHLFLPEAYDGVKINVSAIIAGWSGDECHPNSVGIEIFGKAISDHLYKYL